MPAGRRPDRRQLSRADLPEELTPDTVRGLDIWTIRHLSDRRNGILSAEEQRSFDQALRTVMQDPARRLEQSLHRARRGGPTGLDPELRRSYSRAEARLATQARRARHAVPQLTENWDVPAEPLEPEPEPTAAEDDSISLGELESEIDQTSDTLEILERIASIQEQQLEHQRTQVLRDTRGVFFALVVSVAVIVGGVAPLVQADAHERALIMVWTLAVCAAAAAVYAIVRTRQSKPGAAD